MRLALDLSPLFLYNGAMREQKSIVIYLLRVLFLVLTALTLVFIFAQSTQDGEASSQQSEQVTVQVQEIVGAIAPESPIATATGEQFDLLHALVRSAAHFVEYATLGLFAFASYLSFTRKKRYAPLVPLAIAFVAVFDECVQTMTAGRAAQGEDLLTDILGGGIGCLFALIMFCIVLLLTTIVRQKRQKRENSV